MDGRKSPKGVKSSLVRRMRGTMKPDLFRKDALEHRKGADMPDQLVAQPQLSLWIVLGGILIVLGAVGVSVMMITIPREISGIGLVVQNGTDLEVIFFVPLENGKMIQPGMITHVSPASVDFEEYGYITGSVLSVSPTPVNRTEIAQRFGSPDLAEAILSRSKTAPFAVRSTLSRNPSSRGGFT
jgi:hypothetical protein